jgi:hypothetical protein
MAETTKSRTDFPKTRAALQEAATGNGRNMAKGKPLAGEKGKSETTGVVDVDTLREKAAEAATDGSLDASKIADVKAAIPKERKGFKLD